MRSSLSPLPGQGEGAVMVLLRVHVAGSGHSGREPSRILECPYRRPCIELDTFRGLVLELQQVSEGGVRTRVEETRGVPESLVKVRSEHLLRRSVSSRAALTTRVPLSSARSPHRAANDRHAELPPPSYTNRFFFPMPSEAP
jgi:hypothetical protein